MVEVSMIMETLAMDILLELQKNHRINNGCDEESNKMSDTDNEFLQTSWHFDRATGKDVAKVCFVFDGAVSIDPDDTAEMHDAAMRDAVKKCSGMVSDVAATFGSLAHVRSLRYLMWLTDKEIRVGSDSARAAYSEARRKFTDTVMEAI